MELSKLYEQVTAAREDAVVPGLWFDSHGECWCDGFFIRQDHALALIGWHWLGLLQNNRGLHRGDRGWSIDQCEHDGRWSCTNIELDGGPIATLASYLLATAKEAK